MMTAIGKKRNGGLNNMLYTPDISLTEKEKNWPWGRYDAYLKRDDTKYCKFHPQIHPDNIASIHLKDGETKKQKGKVIEVDRFRYCPRCFIMAK